MNLIQRAKAPTPLFFIKLRNISLAIAAIGATILASPAALPVVVLKVAAYLGVAGSVGSAVSQLVTQQEEEPLNEPIIGTAFPQR